MGKRAEDGKDPGGAQHGPRPVGAQPVGDGAQHCQQPVEGYHNSHKPTCVDTKYSEISNYNQDDKIKSYLKNTITLQVNSSAIQETVTVQQISRGSWIITTWEHFNTQFCS